MRTSPPLLAVVAILGGLGCNAGNRPVTTRSDNGASTSPAGETAAKRDQSLVRVVNAAGAANLALLAGEQPLFTEVGARQVTPYKEVKENMVTFSVQDGRSAAAEQGKNREVLVDGQRYTAVILPADRNGANQLRVLHDELKPDSGKARVRFINAAQEIGEIDVAIRGPNGKPGLGPKAAPERSGRDSSDYLGQARAKVDTAARRAGTRAGAAAADATNDDLFDNLDYGSEGGFRDIEPGTGVLEIRKDGEKRALLSLPNVRFDPGTAYTFVVVHGTGKGLELIRVEDKLGPPTGQEVGVNR